MTATPERIGFVMQPVRRSVAADAGVAAVHGDLARRDDEPVETFFDSTEDADVVAEERLALLSAERRRFAVRVNGLDTALAMSAAGPSLPQAHFADELRGVDRDVLVAEIGFDFASQQATFVVWG